MLPGKSTISQLFNGTRVFVIPFYQLVMSILKKVSDEDERKAIFEYLEAYIVRRMICKRSTKNYSDLFSEALINANITSAQQLIDYINEKDASTALAMPNNAEPLQWHRDVIFEH